MGTPTRFHVALMLCLLLVPVALAADDLCPRWGNPGDRSPRPWAREGAFSRSGTDRLHCPLAFRVISAATPVMPEAMFTSDGYVRAWVLDLLRRAREGKLSEFSSVLTRKTAGRLFARIGGIWLDTALTGKTKIHPILRRSSAEDALLAAGAHLKEILQADSYTIVAVDRTAGICLDDIGIAKRDAPDLLKLLEVLRKGGT